MKLSILTALAFACAILPAEGAEKGAPSTVAPQTQSPSGIKAAPTQIAPAPAGRITAPFSAHPFAATVWLLPEVTIMGDNTVAGSTWIDLLNVSSQPITPSIYILSTSGQLQAELSNYNTGKMGTIPSGSRDSLLLVFPPPRDGTGASTGWAILEAGAPFIAVGHANGYQSGGGVDSERSIPIYPVDCAKPAGIEYVCSFLAAVKKND